MPTAFQPKLETELVHIFKMKRLIKIVGEDNQKGEDKCVNDWKYIKCISCNGYKKDCSDYELKERRIENGR